MVEKLVPDPFIKIRTKHVSGTEPCNVIKFVFIVCPSRSLSNYVNLRCLTLAFTLYTAFVKSKKRPETSLPVSFFCLIFEEKYFSHVLLIDPISLNDYFNLLRYWQNVYCSYLVSSLSGRKVRTMM